MKNTVLYVSDLLTQKVPPEFCFHDFQHTVNVVETVKKILADEKLDSETADLTLLAAWFHDTGYTVCRKGHEDESKRIAQSLMEARNYSEQQIDFVRNCIEATRLPQTPDDLPGMILCDADLHHLGNKDYQYYADLLKTELEKSSGNAISDEDWIAANLGFLKKQRFFTKYGHSAFDQIKEENIQALELKLNALQSTNDRDSN